VLIAPSNNVEKEILSIWEAALNNDQISVTDNFFDLGGNSLIAIQVMIQIDKKLGYHLPLTTLFEAPTIQLLCLLIAKPKKNTVWRSLVPIKPHGDNPPLYIVHGTGLTVMVFNTLANNLSDNQPVYGLQARGLNGVDEPYTNMVAIANYYVNEILLHNPNGPYMLAGYSFGGIVAFEIGKQIKALGKEVKMIALFDTYADNSDNFLSKNQRIFKKIIRQFPKALFFIKSFASNPFATIQYQLLVIKSKINDLLVHMK
jgi:acyl carrier protein